MTQFAALRPKTYSYLTDDNEENKKAIGTKKCVMKQKRKFKDYKQFLEATQFENKINQVEKIKINVDSLTEN